MKVFKILVKISRKEVNVNKILNFIFKFLIFIVVLLTAFVITLKIGIKVDNFKISNFNVSGFYIGLNRNLVLKIDNLEIPISVKHKNENVETELLNITKKITLINKFFDEIDIKNVSLKNQNFALKFNRSVLDFKSPQISLKSYLMPVENGLKTNIESFVLNDFNLSLIGNASLNFKDKIYSFDGNFISSELNGKLRLTSDLKILNVEISDAKAKSIKNFMDEIALKTDMSQTTKNWIYGNIIADNYEIKKFVAKINLKNGEIFKDDFLADGILQNVSVKFDKKLPAVMIGEANVSLRNQSLKFNMENATYLDKNLTNSEVEIYKIFDDDSGIKINLHTSAPFDVKFNKILEAYDIRNPAVQSSGKAEIDVLLDIDFTTENVKAFANAVFKDSKISIGNAEFSSKSGEFTLKENKIFLKNFNLNNEFFNADINGNIDFDTDSGNFDANFASINLPNEILSLKNFNDKISLDFKGKNVILKFKNLGADFSFGVQNSINLTNISHLIKFSSLLKDIGVKNSNVKITTKDFSDFAINAENTYFDSIFSQNGLSYDTANFKILIKNGALEVKSDDEKISFTKNAKNSILSIKDLDVHIKASDDKKQNLNLNFIGVNSKIFIDDLNKTLNFKSYSGKITPQSSELNGKFAKGTFMFKRDKDLQIYAQNLESKDINDFLGRESVEGGEFSLKLKGMSDKFYRGEINAKNTYIKDYVYYQRLLSLINSIPSLLSLKIPDFNSKGFTVSDGKVYFERMGKIVKISAVNLLGSSADIGGSGIIDLDKDDIKVDLELKYLKDASDFISKIPLINQIFLGEDRKISTIIEIRGSINEPKFETKIAQDIISTPLNLIKNTLMLPFVIFE